MLLFLCLFLIFFVYNVHATSTSDPQVLIIGAGVAGAKAAYELSKAGVSFLIVEATDRVGGRLRRRRISPRGPFVEEGASWVQGYVRGEPFSDFVTDVVKLQTDETDFDDSYFYRGGKPVADEEADPVWERVEQALFDAYTFQNASYDASGEITTYASVKSALLAASGWQSGISPIDTAAMRFEIDYEYAMPSSRVSIHELVSFYDPGRTALKDMFVTDRRGYRAVVTTLLRLAGVSNTRRSSAKLLLNTSVSRIAYNRSGAEVTLRNGRRLRANAVISTLPIGVLQHSLLKNPADPTAVQFIPPLPPNKRLAIAKLEDSEYSKLFIQFRRQVFSERDPTFVLPLESDEGGFLNVHNLNKPGYFPGRNMVLVTAVDALSRDLLCMRGKTAVLRKVLRYVSKAAGRHIPLWWVKGFVFPEWHDSPHARGAFSTRMPGMSQQDYQTLNDPLHALFFAGEAHSPAYHGYVQGAYHSAVRTASDVVRFLDTGVSMTNTPLREFTPHKSRQRIPRAVRRELRKKERTAAE